MFCNQCQETICGIACTKRGACGKLESTSNLQDILIYLTRGLAEKYIDNNDEKINYTISNNLFITITNANFDDEAIKDRIVQTSKLIGTLNDIKSIDRLYLDKESIESKIDTEFNKSEDADKQSLRELILYGLKGMAAYYVHANNLGYVDNNIADFIRNTLVKTADDDLSIDELLKLTLETGENGVITMALLDKANIETYGNPEVTNVNIGVGNNPAILISGHDLKDLKELLEQTKGSGVDVYTHSEMLPAHYYPEFKKYDNLVANYGNAWWQQTDEFEKFNGPVLFTTNCIVPTKKSYKDRIFTTGAAGLEGCKHIEVGADGKKDFSEIIDYAKTCKPPTEIERGEIIGGFAHNQVLNLADKIVDAVRSGYIKKFVVMAGCDGRQKERNYYTEFAKSLPDDAIILTAGCAKYRYNKLNLGDICGIPRVLDAGQCNDSYSLALIALKLKEVFGLSDINELPIIYNIAWYEQKAVIVLLALLYLGIKNIHLGPTLPAFLSPNVAKVLVDKFGISGIGSVEEDIKLFFE